MVGARAKVGALTARGLEAEIVTFGALTKTVDWVRASSSSGKPS